MIGILFLCLIPAVGMLSVLFVQFSLAQSHHLTILKANQDRSELNRGHPLVWCNHDGPSTWLQRRKSSKP
ncbi:hypothetical protein K493DRAFT_314391 [Basidiobolus meristosporus CBS 931.73]|uniref:Uncharacterized protein n=1 Tax=Basidiobolus meristosporus CBS 931.73 TaxID=1314790 RepID=A0A1Y1YF88_9FUNG|nr:hypothetical protein K493DRAFT_314391 [Basidiobolus meristosporus CBS 931.73]|eukprot:ORX96710.1 hypothetical protein K493DRAFT_314391 [Basidiobolus meristosporus CBS 931.73]